MLRDGFDGDLERPTFLESGRGHHRFEAAWCDVSSSLGRRAQGEQPSGADVVEAGAAKAAWAVRRREREAAALRGQPANPSLLGAVVPALLPPATGPRGPGMVMTLRSRRGSSCKPRSSPKGTGRRGLIPWSLLAERYTEPVSQACFGRILPFSLAIPSVQNAMVTVFCP